MSQVKTRLVRNIIKITCGLLFLLAMELFLTYVTPFVPHEPQIKQERFTHSLVQNMLISQKCFGLQGRCEIDEIGVTFHLSFTGFTLAIPSANFLNITGWGDRKGWRLEKTYFGRRILSVSNSEGVTIATFRQLLFNKSSYGDFGSYISFDQDKGKIFISNKVYGFFSENEVGWVIEY